jgi:hypothetical protein
MLPQQHMVKPYMTPPLGEVPNIITYNVNDTFFNHPGTDTPAPPDNSTVPYPACGPAGTFCDGGLQPKPCKDATAILKAYGATDSRLLPTIRAQCGDTAVKQTWQTSGQAADGVFHGTQSSVTSAAVANALGAAASTAARSGVSAPAPGSGAALHAAQTVINAGYPAEMGPALMGAAMQSGVPHVAVPPAYGGGTVSKHKASGSVMNYFFQPTFVSRALPITPDAHAAAIAAASVNRVPM